MSYNGQTPWQRSNLGNVMPSGFQQHQQPPMYLQQPPAMAASFGHGPGPVYGGGGTGGNTVPYQASRGGAGLNPMAFQHGSGPAVGTGGGSSSGGGQSQNFNSVGTVTKINNDCGLVNDEVFFYRSVCKGHAPKLGDRVMFESNYAASGQFKWNATRVQLMPTQQHAQPPAPGLIGGGGTKANVFGGAPPPASNEYRSATRRGSTSRDQRHLRDRRERDRSHRPREEEEQDRKRRREEPERGRAPTAASGRGDRSKDREREREGRDRERERDRERDRNDREKERAERSPPRTSMAKGRRTRAIRRYVVQIPKSLLIKRSVDVQELRQRYSMLYIPSDFFNANIKWSDTFTPDNPFSLRRPCQFHIMHKIVESPFESKSEPLDPPDANYSYSAKVMLLACPPLVELYQKCFEEDDSDGEQPTSVHPSRLISFLVGTRNRNEPMAIGGAWSPSLDGKHPDKDPAVLIRTAIRTCKALTGIDLSNCTQWYRFVELHYLRTDYKHKDKDKDQARVETVVIYLPDIHSCMPGIADWQNLTDYYRNAVDNVITRKTNAGNGGGKSASEGGTALASTEAEAMVAGGASTLANHSTTNGGGGTALDNDNDNNNNNEGGEAEHGTAPNEVHSNVIDVEADNSLETDLITAAGGTSTAPNEVNHGDADADVAAGGEKGAAAAGGGDGDGNNEKAHPVTATHYSQLELKSMNVPQIREQLIARQLSAIGPRNVLMARLATALNVERAAAAKNCPGKADEVGETAAKDEVTSSTTAGDAADDLEEQEEWADVIDVDMSDIVILDEYDSSKNPEEPKEMDEKERSQLVRRYTLPEVPHIVVHPNREAKGGKFDCSVMSLSVLLDYGPEDCKERFFEVSLFAELFNEMLIRDFGFNIYKEVYLHKLNATNNPESGDASDASSAKKDDDNQNEEKALQAVTGEDKTKADEENQSIASGTERDRKRKATKEKEKENGTNDKKMIVAKPQLLLSFLYFDTTRCGYVFERDLEDLFAILGLRLSRGQIRGVLGKMATRQAFYYRKLTDKEESFEVTPTLEDTDSGAAEELIKKLALGNRQFESEQQAGTEANGSVSKSEDDGLITYNGTVVHVGKLLEQFKRTEKSFSDLEKLHQDLRKQHTDMHKEHSKSSSKIKDLQAEVKSLSRKLSDADQDLFSLNRKYRDQHSTLSHIYHRLEPIFAREKEKEKEKEREKEKEKETKSESNDKDKSKSSKDNKDNKSSKDKDSKQSKDPKEKHLDTAKDSTKHTEGKEKDKDVDKQQEQIQNDEKSEDTQNENEIIEMEVIDVDDENDEESEVAKD